MPRKTEPIDDESLAGLIMAVTAEAGRAGWRVEPAHNGTVWQLRERGSRDNGRKRKTRYLGAMSKMTKRKAEEYES